MSIQLSPGVNVIEKDFTQIVPTVSTSTGAIAGPFKWGPVEQPVLVANESDLLAAYGKPTPDCYRTFFIAKNFLDYSKMMYATRTDSWAGRNAVSIQSGGVSKITIKNAGSKSYTVPPLLSIEAPAIPGGVTAIATASLTGGKIVGAQIVNGGIGYSVGDTIEFSAPEVPVETFDPVTGVLIDSTYDSARATVGGVGEGGVITSIVFVDSNGVQTRGSGYIDPSAITYSVYNSTGTADSGGIGAEFSINVGKSSIRAVTVTKVGSGYTLEQMPTFNITVTPAEEDTDVVLDPSYVDPELEASITVSGVKIKNAAHYDSSFANNQGVYGEFAAKYPGVYGNNIVVSMCDRDNWSTPLGGSFYARKNIEDNEKSPELLTVRRVIEDASEGDTIALDAGKILRTVSGKLIGEIDRVDPDKYVKITFDKDVKTLLPIGTHIRRHAYSKDGSTKFDIEYAERTGTTITITLKRKFVNGVEKLHNFKPGDFIDVYVGSIPGKVGSAPRAGLGNISFTNHAAAMPQSEKITVTAVTADTVTYTIDNPTWKVGGFSRERRDGYIQSTSQGYIDGYVKEYDEKDDEFKISNRSFYVKTAPSFNVSDTSVLRTWDGIEIGNVESAVDVQNIVLNTTQSSSANDVYGEACVAEWKYKSLFGDIAPGTSSYAKAADGINDELHIVVLNEKGTVIEKYQSVSKASDAKDSTGKSIYYKNVINNTSRWLWVLDHPIEVESDSLKADWGKPAAKSDFKLLTLAVTRSLSGGVDGNISSAAHYLTAYSMFSDKTTYDVSLFPLDYMAASTVKSIITDVIEKRRDCIATVSPPLYVGNSMGIAQNIVKYRNDIGSSSYAVMDSGWKYQYDKYNDEFRWIPLSGDVAGLCAYTDAIADTWFSPAGFSRGQIKNVIKLSFNPMLEQRDLLYSNGINPVVTFPAEGTILYGDKTLQTKTSAFDRINVRRLFIVLEKSIALASKYQLFEFNDDFTRAQFRSMVEPYLRDVQGRRGITDFLVKCDSSNNTPLVIDRNEFIADIYIKPARSINFITLNFVATKTGVSFDEIAG